MRPEGAAWLVLVGKYGKRGKMEASSPSFEPSRRKEGLRRYIRVGSSGKLSEARERDSEKVECFFVVGRRVGVWAVREAMCRGVDVEMQKLIE
jgi:hypothetical protein